MPVVWCLRRADRVGPGNVPSPLAGEGQVEGGLQRPDWKVCSQCCSLFWRYDDPTGQGPLARERHQRSPFAVDARSLSRLLVPDPLIRGSKGSELPG